MKNIIKITIFMAAIVSLSACQKAVRAHENVSFRVQGDLHSALYPMHVEQRSEDVYIQLKVSAPVPEISSLDVNGNEEVFLFNIEQDMLIVPGKFDHLCLRHAGEKTIDIVRDDLYAGPSCKEKQ
ncbi:MAG: hypothetical protein H7252_07405 [Cytophaga sp.]|nr:hypothetical protein [Undibacterium sp.]